MAESLENVLSDKPVETPKEPAAPQQETIEVPKVESRRRIWQKKEWESQGRDPETGQFKPKETEAVKAKTEEKKEETKEVKAETKVETKEKPAAPQQELSDKEKAFLRAMQEERTKRQELERRLKAIEESKPKEPEKTFWDDPEGALAKHNAEIKRYQDEIRNQAHISRMNTAELIARNRYTDFDEKLTVFGDLLKETPGLYEKWMTAPDPAEFAYKVGKNHKDLQEAGNIDELKSRIEKETRLKIEKELKEKAEKLEKERAAIPPSLSEAHSKGSTKVVWSGPTPLDSILER